MLKNANQFVRHVVTVGILGACLMPPSGCNRYIKRSTDDVAYDAIAQRQRESLGFATDVKINEPEGNRDIERLYSFTPRPLPADLPEAFTKPPKTAPRPKVAAPPAAAPLPEDIAPPEGATPREAAPPPEVSPPADSTPSGAATNPPKQANPPKAKKPEAAGEGTAPGDEDVEGLGIDLENFTADPGAETEAPGAEGVVHTPTLAEMLQVDAKEGEDPLNAGRVFDLRHCLAYAQLHARDLQNAKEDLYLAALSLTLERHLWTPQFSAQVTSDYKDYKADATFDQALTSVAEVAVSQRLPLGGEVAARAIATFVDDLNSHVNDAESGQVILDANIPLFRGAGRVAYESRYAAERGLIYAVRRYERFRRTFLVQVASSYFDVQNQKQAVRNTEKSFDSRRDEWERAEFIERMGRSDTVFDTSRAQSSLRRAESALVGAQEAYASQMDQLKILIGMSVEEQLNVIDQADDEVSDTLDRLLADVPLNKAIETGLTYRLDLLTDADLVDDARRGLTIAKNQVLPDLDFTGQIVGDSNPTHQSTTTFGQDRTSWSAGLQFRIDDRRKEINGYREAVVNVRRAERSHEEFRDQVRADVRRAVRRIQRTAAVREIEIKNAEENAVRLEAAKVQFRLGKSTNQNVVDAEDELLAARNVAAEAVAAYRVSILAYRRDTGTLRVDEHGAWVDRAPSPEPDKTGP